MHIAPWTKYSSSILGQAFLIFLISGSVTSLARIILETSCFSQKRAASELVVLACVERWIRGGPSAFLFDRAVGPLKIFIAKLIIPGSLAIIASGLTFFMNFRCFSRVSRC